MIQETVHEKDRGEALTADEQRALVALCDAEIAGTPKPRNLSPVGGLVFVLSVALFFALAILTRRWELPILVRSSIFFVLVAGLIGGLGMIFFGGSGQSRARRRAEAALGHLATRFKESTVTENQGALVRLLASAYYSGGRWKATTIDVGGAKERLESAGVLPWVLEAERVLVAERRSQPLFTVTG